MCEYVSYRDIDEKAPEPPSINRFLELHVSLGKQRISEIENHSQWFPQKWEKLTENRMRLRLPDKDGSTFTIFVELTDSNEKFTFKRLVMEPMRNEALPVADLGVFCLGESNSQWILERKG